MAPRTPRSRDWDECRFHASESQKHEDPGREKTTRAPTNWATDVVRQHEKGRPQDDKISGGSRHLEHTRLAVLSLVEYIVYFFSSPSGAIFARVRRLAKIELD